MFKLFQCYKFPRFPVYMCLNLFAHVVELKPEVVMSSLVLNKTDFYGDD
jgi:hypothetical protein